MAEILVATASRNDPDPYIDVGLFKRGDVIVVQPDGWVWGWSEMSSDEWAIYHLPGVSREVAESFLGPERVEDAEQSRMMQRRQFRLDIDGLPADLDTVNDVMLLGLKRRRPPIEDPNILG